MKRNKNSRPVDKKIINDKVLILCCGKTEKKYFDFLRQHFKIELKNVKIKILSAKNNISISMVEEAITYISEYFEIWVVFDKDIDPGFDDAIRKANNNGIKCAFSNVAFEYWLLLHLADKSGILSISDLNNEITRLLGYKYLKNKNMDRVCKDIIKEIFEAEKRARIRHEEHKKDPNKRYSAWCSCTTVYMLTKRLRELNEIFG